MEHTNEFLRGMFSAYMGCEVEYKMVTFQNIGLSFKGLFFDSRHLGGGIAEKPFKHCKPILTPISKISDEDAVEVAKIIYGDEFYKYTWEMSRHNSPNFVCLNNIDDDDYSIIFTVGKDYKHSICIEAFMPNNQHTTMFYVVDYLRSKKYDCGYLHISSLIEAGLAVKAPR